MPSVLLGAAIFDEAADEFGACPLPCIEFPFEFDEPAPKRSRMLFDIGGVLLKIEVGKDSFDSGNGDGGT